MKMAKKFGIMLASAVFAVALAQPAFANGGGDDDGGDPSGMANHNTSHNTNHNNNHNGNHNANSNSNGNYNLNYDANSNFNYSASNANAGALSASRSSSHSNANAVGVGGAGGSAGAFSNASTGNMSTDVTTGPVKTGDSTSSASASNMGNGNGATVTTTNTDNSRVFFPVQAPDLPATITAGTIRLVKDGVCGRRVKIKPFKRFTRMPQALGLWSEKIPVESMQGTFEGFDEEKPFIVDTVELPAPFSQRIVTAYGHQLYLAVGNDGLGGGSTGAADYATNRSMGLSAGLNSNSSYGVIGMVAVSCVYAQKEQSTAPVHAAALTTVKATPELIVRTEKQGLIRKEAYTKKAVPAGTKYYYYVPGPVEKTEVSAKR